MEHPGPPRFAAVGDEIELAPRDPDPEAAYSWTVVDAPAPSEATVGDEPVVHFEPDAPGRYRVRHGTPAETYHLTVRAFGADRRPGETETRQQYSGTEPPTTTDHTVTETDAVEAATDDPGSGLARLDAEETPERPLLDLDAHDEAGEIVVTARVDDTGRPVARSTRPSSSSSTTATNSTQSQSSTRAGSGWTPTRSGSDCVSTRSRSPTATASRHRSTSNVWEGTTGRPPI
ncbi:MAG: hypothetical protein J07HB67_02865 [halophilic archaeon J07HB67]|jgi:hypothetical protein|nr:MAG: hypothetical protein J07HB67_02865 [halophilic archaeon J07HB67]